MANPAANEEARCSAKPTRGPKYTRGQRVADAPKGYLRVRTAESSSPRKYGSDDHSSAEYRPLECPERGAPKTSPQKPSPKSWVTKAGTENWCCRCSQRLANGCARSWGLELGTGVGDLELGTTLTRLPQKGWAWREVEAERRSSPVQGSATAQSPPQLTPASERPASERLVRKVRSTGFEPARHCWHQALNLARLPIPPRPQIIKLAA